MGLTATIASRSLLQRPGRTLFSILGIAMGIATVVGVIVLDATTIQGMSGRRGGGADADLEIRPIQGIEGDTVELRDVEGVAQASAFFQNDAVVRPPEARPGSDETKVARLFALESQDFAELGVHRLVAGRDLTAADGVREVLIGQRLASELDVEIGSVLWISRPRRIARKACIDGELRVVEPAQATLVKELDFEVVGILARERLGRRSGGMVVLIDYAWGEELYEGAHIETRYWAKRDPTVDLERLQASLSQRFSYDLNQSVVVGQAADERAFRTGVRMAGLLALVLGLYVIFHTLSMSLTERISEVGALHALGVTRPHIARIFLAEATFLAGLGALLGLAGGIALAFGLSRLGITTLGSGKYFKQLVVPWSTVLPLTGVGFGIALVGSVYPLARLGGTSIASVLRGEQTALTGRAARGFHLFTALLLAIVLPGLYFVLVPVVGEFTAPLVSLLLAGVGFLGLLVMLPLVMPRILSGVCTALTRPLATRWPFAGRVAARAMAQNPTRIAVSASAIALVSAGLVGLKGMTNSLRGEVQVWGAEAAADKVWVRDLPNVPYAVLAEHLLAFPGIAGVENGSATTYVPFRLVGVDVDSLAGYGPCGDDPALLAKMKDEHGIVLSRRLAEDLGYAIGDACAIAKADGTLQEFRVVAISDAYGYFPNPDERLYGVVSDATMQRYYCLDVETVTEVAVRLTDGTDPGTAEAALLDLAASGKIGVPGRDPDWSKMSFKSGGEVLAHHVADISFDFILFDVLIGLTAVLAGLGVLNGQLLAALERSKEIGVMKALGVSRGQVAGMVMLESLVVGVVGGGCGILLGSGMTPVVVEALQELAGLALPSRGAGAWLGVAFLGAALIALLAGLYPIWRMNRVDAVRAVRTG